MRGERSEPCYGARGKKEGENKEIEKKERGKKEGGEGLRAARRARTVESQRETSERSE
jgi:hypothetical protein